jgi:hypothetical protein
MIQRILKPERQFDSWKDDNEFYQSAQRATRSYCILDMTKLLNAGVEMRSVEEAVEDSLRRWQWATPPLELLVDH